MLINRYIVTPLSNATHSEDGGVQEDRQIHKQIPVLDVVKVVLDVFVDKVIAIAAELPEAGNPWLDLEPLRMVFVVGRDDERHLGSRPDERHIPGNDVE